MGSATTTPASSDERGDMDELPLLTEVERSVFSTTGTDSGTVTTAAAEDAMMTCVVGARVRNWGEGAILEL